MPVPNSQMSAAENIASAFHAAYEGLAPSAGYETRKESAVPWADVPAANKALMIATVEALLSSGVIQAASPAPHPLVGTNARHGHVWPRPDGTVARCGGPGMCGQCSRDQALVSARPQSSGGAS